MTQERGGQQTACAKSNLKILNGEPAREVVLEILHGERAVVRHLARLAGEEAGVTLRVLALVARDREVDLALREVDDAPMLNPPTGPSSSDAVHVDDLAVAACRGAPRATIKARSGILRRSAHNIRVTDKK